MVTAFLIALTVFSFLYSLVITPMIFMGTIKFLLFVIFLLISVFVMTFVIKSWRNRNEKENT